MALREAHPISADSLPQLRQGLGAPHNPDLFPEHFLKSTLPKVGGHIITGSGGTEFFFPTPQGGISRFHHEGKMTYQPFGHNLETISYTPTHHQMGDLDIGHPNEEEAQQIRQLQADIWQTESDRLYPVDIHSDQFGLPTSLVARARADGEVVGFLFGFWRKKDNNGWQIESQLAGVLDSHRSKGVAFQLKIEQALIARQMEIDIITWTADPLQVANTILNTNKLGGRANKFYPDLYSFAGANVHNQTPASRFEYCWDLTDPVAVRVLETRQPGNPSRPNLDSFPGIEVVWRGRIPSSDTLAIEIPRNWTELQQNKSEALAFRTNTDAVFRQIIGAYSIVCAAFDGETPYLIAKKNG